MASPSSRKFYRTVFQYEVLSEEPINNESLTLAQIDSETTDGEWSGQFLPTQVTVLDGPAAAQALIEQGSAPEFFQLNALGDDLDPDLH